MSEPTTEAGRTLLVREAPFPFAADPTEEWVAVAAVRRDQLAADILAIEAEARAEGSEAGFRAGYAAAIARLPEALHAVYGETGCDHTPLRMCESIAEEVREYLAIDKAAGE